eukprot:g4059.t1
MMMAGGSKAYYAIGFVALLVAFTPGLPPWERARDLELDGEPRGARANRHRLDRGTTTPIMQAAAQCNVEETQSHLQLAEGDLEREMLVSDFETGGTALHHACSCPNAVRELVRVLAGACAGHAACLNAQDDAGWTPMAKCVLTATWMDRGDAHLDSVQLLIEHGADPNIGNIYGVTPFMLATRGKLARMVDLLVGHIDLEARDVHGNTAMMFAASWFGEVATAGVRLVAGEDPQQIVQSFAFEGVEDACLIELQSAAERGTGDKRHLESTDVSASFVAQALIKCEFLIRIVNALISFGAQLNVTNNRGETALHVAHPAMLVPMREKFLSLSRTKAGRGDREKQWALTMSKRSALGRVASQSEESWATTVDPRFSKTPATNFSCEIPSVHISDLDAETFRKDYLGWGIFK